MAAPPSFSIFTQQPCHATHLPRAPALAFRSHRSSATRRKSDHHHRDAIFFHRQPSASFIFSAAQPWQQRTSLHPHSRPPSARTSAVPQLPDSRSHAGAAAIAVSHAVNRHCHLHLHCICRNPNFGERKCTATCQHLIGQSNWSTGQFWSTGQSQQSTLVKTANMVKWEGQNWKLYRN